MARLYEPPVAFCEECFFYVKVRLIITACVELRLSHDSFLQDSISGVTINNQFYTIFKWHVLL